MKNLEKLFYKVQKEYQTRNGGRWNCSVNIPTHIYLSITILQIQIVSQKTTILPIDICWVIIHVSPTRKYLYCHPLTANININCFRGGRPNPLKKQNSVQWVIIGVLGCAYTYNVNFIIICFINHLCFCFLYLEVINQKVSTNPVKFHFV